MPEAARQTRSYLMELFEKHGRHPRWDLGQNFLVDLNILDLVVAAAELEPTDVVLEVGAGTGGMTAFLAQQADHVVSVEIDRNLAALAAESVAGFDNVTLLNVDALKNKNRFNPRVLDTIDALLAADSRRRLKLVANLPYSVATPVVSNLVATSLPWTRMVITIQLELAERMQAGPRTSAYGALSVWLQAQCQVTILKKLPPSVFWPRPQVHSAVVEIRPDPEAAGRIADRAFFHDHVRDLFTLRRKQLRRVLAGMYRDLLDGAQADAALSELGLPETARAEELPVTTHVELANRIFEALSTSQDGPRTMAPPTVE